MTGIYNSPFLYDPIARRWEFHGTELCRPTGATPGIRHDQTRAMFEKLGITNLATLRDAEERARRVAGT